MDKPQLAAAVSPATMAEPSPLLSFVCCPRPDHGKLEPISATAWRCLACATVFPVCAGRPILIDEARSLFAVQGIAARADRRQFPECSGWRYGLRKMFPAAASRDVALEILTRHRSALGPQPLALVIGCGFTGEAYLKLFAPGRVFLTDVTLQGTADLACDGAGLPFRDQSLDCVIIDQVLEHSLDPVGVVHEVTRCLKAGGLVYSGIPFHMPVHGFPYDFQRYTPLGHRLLFRRFDEVEFVVTQGSVSGLSRSVLNFSVDLSKNLWWRRFSGLAVRILFAPLLLLDKRFRGRRELTIAGATAFLGRKRADALNPQELLAGWRDRSV